jgi:hypothetical protein
MSQPLVSQPGRSFHAAQRFPTNRPMPQLVDTSTQTSGSTLTRIARRCELDSLTRTSFHHQTSEMMVAGTWWRAKLLGNFDRNAERDGRKLRPSRYTKVICWRVPWSEATSLRTTDNFAAVKNVLSLSRALVHFLSGRETERARRSQPKPAYSKVAAKSCPLLETGCQGIPRGADMEWIVARS